MANVITGSGVMKQSKKAAKGGKKSAVSVATPIFLRVGPVLKREVRVWLEDQFSPISLSCFFIHLISHPFSVVLTVSFIVDRKHTR